MVRYNLDTAFSEHNNPRYKEFKYWHGEDLSHLLIMHSLLNTERTGDMGHYLAN